MDVLNTATNNPGGPFRVTERPRARILVVEDQVQTAEVLQGGLQAAGYETDWVATVARARRQLRASPWDLIVLDIRLPDGSGLDLCAEVRAEGDTPIIVVSGADSPHERVAGFEAGADDYVVKPVHLAELHKRVEAVLRRSHPRSESDLVEAPGGLALHTSSGDAVFRGQRVRLTRSELGIMQVLMERPGVAHSAAELCRRVWDYEVVADSNFIQQHVSRLRRKLARIGADGLVETVYGMGYAISDAEETADTIRGSEHRSAEQQAS